MTTACPDCARYVRRRGGVIARAIVLRHGPSYEACMTACGRFMAGVHARHLSGLPILEGETP